MKVTTRIAANPRTLRMIIIDRLQYLELLFAKVRRHSICDLHLGRIHTDWPKILRQIAGSADLSRPSENPQDGGDKTLTAFVGMVTEEVYTLNRREGSAAANVTIRYFTIVEADWY